MHSDANLTRHRWNSAIFTSIPVTAYVAAITTNDYLTSDAIWNGTASDRSLQIRGRNFERLNTSACIQRYIEPLAAMKDVIVVTNAKNDSYSFNDGSSLFETINSPPENQGFSWTTAPVWMCLLYTEARSVTHVGSGCTIETLRPYLNNWTLSLDLARGKAILPVEYCLSDGVGDQSDHCDLHFSPVIMALVCAFNLVKCVLVSYTAFISGRAKRQTLITLGDAIHTFLEQPDENTKNMCLSSRFDFGKIDWGPPGGKAKWQPQRRFWFQGAPWARWATTIAL